MDAVLGLMTAKINFFASLPALRLHSRIADPFCSVDMLPSTTRYYRCGRMVCLLDTIQRVVSQAIVGRFPSVALVITEGEMEYNAIVHTLHCQFIRLHYAGDVSPSIRVYQPGSRSQSGPHHNIPYV
jgi:hypothetical protein